MNPLCPKRDCGAPLVEVHNRASGSIKWVCELCTLNAQGICRRCKVRKLPAYKGCGRYPLFCPTCKVERDTERRQSEGYKKVKAKNDKKRSKRRVRKPTPSIKGDPIARRVKREKMRAYRATPEGKAATQRANKKQWQKRKSLAESMSQESGRKVPASLL